MVNSHGVFVPPESRRVGIVFQDYALFPHLDVSGNIAFGLPKKVDRKKRVKEMLTLIGLKGIEHRMPHELSGGEQQRVAVARALINSPEVILADEPSGNLDTQNKEELHQLFFALRDKFQQTFSGHQTVIYRQSEPRGLKRLTALGQALYRSRKMEIRHGAVADMPALSI